MWHQHDGATAYKSAQPCTFLVQTLDTRIIGYRGQQEWPPWSPDLNPLDFFLWGYLKSKMYKCESTSKSDLLNRISMACRFVTPTMLQKLQAEFLAWVRYCISVEGNHFERYLSSFGHSDIIKPLIHDWRIIPHYATIWMVNPGFFLCCLLKQAV